MKRALGLGGLGQMLVDERDQTAPSAAGGRCHMSGQPASFCSSSIQATGQIA
jgi:hypothetical protein